MKKIILEALENKGIIVKNLEHHESDNNSGLLHEPIMKFKAVTNIGTIQLVIKTVNILFPPEMLFRQLYKECESHNLQVDLKQFDKCCHYLSMRNMPSREYYFYKNLPESIRKFVPVVWDCVIYNNTQMLIMEDLSQCINMNKIDSPEVWDRSFLLQTVKDLATIHYSLRLFNKCIHHEFNFKQISDFLLNFHTTITFGCEITVEPKVYYAGKKFIAELDKYESILSEGEVIIHNDFNIRNICVSHNKEHIKVYDWEFWDIGCPMLDIVDLLLSISPKYINRKTIDEMIKIYATNYSKLSGIEFSSQHYFDLLYYSALKYSATRMNMYLLCYKKTKLQYIERMYTNLKNILELYKLKE